MTTISYNRLLALICFVLPLSFLLSCEKEDNEDDGRVELISFGPTGAEHGDTIRFFGRNLNKVTAVQFAGTNAIVDQKDFKNQTSELILLVVPNTAEKGFVTLKTPAGDIVSKTQFNLKVAATVSAIVPPQARPGENITINGNFLNWVNRVTFARDKVVTTFVSKTLNQLVVKVPDDAQTGPLILSYQGTDSSFVQTTDTLRVTLPMITGLSPNPVKHADNVTITGTNLDLARKVIFQGVATPVTSFVSQSATQLVVKVPGAAAKGKVTLEAASGVQTTSGSDLDVMLPAVTAMAPNPVSIGSDLTITGTNLDLVSGVSFTGVAAPVTTFVSVSPTQLVVKVPTGALLGRLTLGVKNSTLTVQSATQLQIAGSTVAPLIVYDNAVSADWDIWGGWGTASQDFNNSEQPLSGTKAIKVVYSSTDAWGAIQLHPKNNFPFPPAGYSKLKLSVYGGAGTSATTRIAVYIKDATDPTDAQQVKLTLVPGTYTTYEIPLASFSNNPAKINELVIKNYGTAGITIYVDDIWFE